MDRQEKEKEFHNKAFGESTRHNLSKVYSIVEISNRFYRNYLFSYCGNKRMLEMGCGPGHYSLFFALRCAFVVGVDISNVAIEQAVKKAQAQKIRNIAFSEMDVEALACKNNYFDVVCGIGLIHHLDLKKLSLELKRVLKTEGDAVFIEPLGHNPLINLFRKLTPHLRTEDEHPLLMPDLALLKSYFHKTEFFYFHFLTLLLIPFHRLSGFHRALNMTARIDQMIFRLFPLLKKYAWVVMIVIHQ